MDMDKLYYCKNCKNVVTNVDILKECPLCDGFFCDNAYLFKIDDVYKNLLSYLDIFYISYLTGIEKVDLI